MSHDFNPTLRRPEPEAEKNNSSNTPFVSRGRGVCFNDWKAAGLPDDFDAFLVWIFTLDPELPNPATYNQEREPQRLFATLRAKYADPNTPRDEREQARMILHELTKGA